MSFFDRNISILREKDPDLTASICAAREPESSFEILPTPSGIPTVKFEGIFIHSSRDPAEEARRTIKKEFPSSPGACIFAGFGLGYQVEQFIEMYPHVPVVIFEPQPALFLKALESRDITSLLSHPSVSFFIGVNEQTVLGYLQAIKAGNIALHMLRGMASTRGEVFRELKELITSYAEREEINKNTLKRFGKVWIRNFLKNIPHLIKGHNISCIEKKFPSFPSCILAGGPGLDQVLPKLGELRKKCIILAVDTSLRACLSTGIEPDFLVVVDPQYWNTRHLDHCRAPDALLISESSTHPSIFRIHPGRTYFCSSLFPLGRYIEHEIGIFGKLGAGGSVATTAWDLCRYMGSGPIIFAGLDLGFPEMKTHFKGSFFESRLLYIADRIHSAETSQFNYLYDAAPFRTENNIGGTVLTDRRLIVYKRWFEQQMKMHADVETLTFSREGVQIPGITFTTMENVLDMDDRRSEIDSILKEIRKSPAIERNEAKEAVQGSVTALVDKLNDLRNLASSCVDLTNILLKSNPGGAEVNHILEELEKTDRLIMSTEIQDIAGFLLYDVSMDVIGNPAHSPEKALEQSHHLYKSLVSSIDYHTTQLETTLKTI